MGGGIYITYCSHMVWSEGGEEQGGGRDRAGQHRLPIETVSFEPLLVDSEVEPETGGIQETGHT